MDSLVIYGTGVVVVVAAIAALIKHFRPETTDGTLNLIRAIGIVIGYLLAENLPYLEQFIPLLPEIVPQILTAILLFAATLGVTPAVNATGRGVRKAYRALTK